MPGAGKTKADPVSAGLSALALNEPKSSAALSGTNILGRDTRITNTGIRSAMLGDEWIEQMGTRPTDTTAPRSIMDASRPVSRDYLDRALKSGAALNANGLPFSSDSEFNIRDHIVRGGVPSLSPTVNPPGAPNNFSLPNTGGIDLIGNLQRNREAQEAAAAAAAAARGITSYNGWFDEPAARDMREKFMQVQPASPSDSIPQQRQQHEKLIDTIMAEALGDGYEGMKDVAHVIQNRSVADGRTAFEVISDPGDFTGADNPGRQVAQDMRNPEYRRLAEQAWADSAYEADPTKGAVHYHTPYVEPYWAEEADNGYGRISLNGHVFYPSYDGPGQPRSYPASGNAPTQVASSAPQSFAPADASGAEIVSLPRPRPDTAPQVAAVASPPGLEPVRTAEARPGYEILQDWANEVGGAFQRQFFGAPSAAIDPTSVPAVTDDGLSIRSVPSVGIDYRTGMPVTSTPTAPSVDGDPIQMITDWSNGTQYASGPGRYTSDLGAMPSPGMVGDFRLLDTLPNGSVNVRADQSRLESAPNYDDPDGGQRAWEDLVRMFPSGDGLQLAPIETAAAPAVMSTTAPAQDLGTYRLAEQDPWDGMRLGAPAGDLPAGVVTGSPTSIAAPAGSQMGDVVNTGNRTGQESGEVTTWDRIADGAGQVFEHTTLGGGLKLLSDITGTNFWDSFGASITGLDDRGPGQLATIGPETEPVAYGKSDTSDFDNGTPGSPGNPVDPNDGKGNSDNDGNGPGNGNGTSGLASDWEYEVVFPPDDYRPGVDGEWQYFRRKAKTGKPGDGKGETKGNTSSDSGAGGGRGSSSTPIGGRGGSVGDVFSGYGRGQSAEEILADMAQRAGISLPDTKELNSSLGIGGRGFAEGGYVDQAAPPQPVPALAGQDPRTQVLAEAEAALRGRHPNPEAAISAFVKMFGEVALRNLQERVGQEEATADLGRMVQGPGGPTDDMVPAVIDGNEPAKLSNGEFVMTADAVANAGGGDPEQGAQMLMSLNKELSGAGPGARR